MAQYKITSWGAVVASGSIDSMVRQRTDGSDYGRGSVETARATAEKTGECLANLLDVLVRRGVVKLEDVLEILGFSSEAMIEIESEEA